MPLPDLPDLEGLLDGLSEGVLALSPTRAILFANAALAPLLNRPPRDCRGIPLWEALRHRDIGALADAVLREGQEISREVVVAAPEERVYHVRARPRVPSGAVLVFNDLTSLRRLERLRQEFVANVSHELKTPLTALRAALETLLDGAMDDPAHARDFLETAEQEVHRLQRLIDDLLDLSRWERPGAAPRLPTSTLFDEVARNTFAALRPLAAKKNVTLEARWPDEPTRVAISSDELTRVLFNLLDNAIKFNRPNGRVTLLATRQTHALELHVIDTGVGISPEEQKRVFERFYRSDKARSRDLGGTGLGLSLVKHIVESHGGTVRVDSLPQQGSTFIVVLPLAAPTAPPPSA